MTYIVFGEMLNLAQSHPITQLWLVTYITWSYEMIGLMYRTAKPLYTVFNTPETGYILVEKLAPDHI